MGFRFSLPSQTIRNLGFKDQMSMRVRFTSPSQAAMTMHFRKQRLMRLCLGLGLGLGGLVFDAPGTVRIRVQRPMKFRFSVPSQTLMNGGSRKQRL